MIVGCYRINCGCRAGIKRNIKKMKRLIVIVLFMNFLVFPAIIAQDSERNAQFDSGTGLFSEGDYQGALDEWLSVYKTGYSSPELCYNIGNAYFKLNNIPGAILFYERALLLDPTDEDINYNLNISRTRVVDRMEEIPELFFVRWFNVVSLLLPSNTWAVISIVSFVVCLILLSVYFFTSDYKLKVAAFWVSLVFLFVSLSSISNSIRSKNMIFHNESAIIFSSQVRGKSSPDDSGNDLFVLHEGTKVEVTDKVGEWLEIRLSDGNKGWVPASGLEII